jgi:arsenate reductase
MAEFTIYHNPRCSKSRQTLELLQENNISPEIILYLDQKLSSNELISLLDKLGISARDLVRSSEYAYMTLGLSNTDLSDDQLIDAMISEPKLIQRPIVVSGNRAVLGRPPENVLDLL